MRLALLGALLFSLLTLADESSVKLKDGPARALVGGRCVVCHSLDYIPMNSVFLDRGGWEAEVKKMVKAFGAPIPPGEVSRIVDYLAQNYGTK